MSLLSNYKVVTITHHNLNVNDIGHFFLRKNSDDPQYQKQVAHLKEQFGFEECVYLETCNRVTFLFFAEFTITNAFLGAFFSDVNPQLEAKTLDNISKFVTVYEGVAAINHVFEMASSMDSLVVGEREIFRQFREAYERCRAAGFTGDYLRILDKATVTTAKEIYSNTKIGEKPLSVVSLAMSAMLKGKVNKDSRILLIGAGETNTLVAKFLRKYEFGNIKIYNRSLHNAEELASEIGATSYYIQELENIKGEFDIIFICTSANEVIVDEKLYAKMLDGSKSRKTIIDLAVPRNVSLSVVNNNDVEHIDIEGLRKLSEENLKFRKLEVEKARPIIRRNLVAFNKVFHGRQIEKAMAIVPVEIAAIKTKALDSVYKNRIDGLDDNSKELLLEMMDYMEKKCISVPMRLAKGSLVE